MPPPGARDAARSPRAGRHGGHHDGDGRRHCGRDGAPPGVAEAPAEPASALGGRRSSWEGFSAAAGSRDDGRDRGDSVDVGGGRDRLDDGRGGRGQRERDDAGGGRDQRDRDDWGGRDRLDDGRGGRGQRERDDAGGRRDQRDRDDRGGRNRLDGGRGGRGQRERDDAGGGRDQRDRDDWGGRDRLDDGRGGRGQRDPVEGWYRRDRDDRGGKDRRDDGRGGRGQRDRDDDYGSRDRLDDRCEREWQDCGGARGRRDQQDAGGLRDDRRSPAGAVGAGAGARGGGPRSPWEGRGVGGGSNLAALCSPDGPRGGQDLASTPPPRGWASDAMPPARAAGLALGARRAGASPVRGASPLSGAMGYRSASEVSLGEPDPGSLVWQGPLLQERPRVVGTAGFLAELEQVLMLVEQQSLQMVRETQADIEEVQHDVLTLLEGLQAMRAARELSEEKNQRRERAIEGRRQAVVAETIGAREELEAKLRELWQHQVGALQQVYHDQPAGILGAEGVQRVGQQVRQIREELEAERHARQGRSEGLLSSLEAELRGAREAMLAHSRQRFETEAKGVQLAEDVRAEIRELLRHEVAEREAVQDKLLSLLEDVTARSEHYAPAPEGAATRADGTHVEGRTQARARPRRRRGFLRQGAARASAERAPPPPWWGACACRRRCRRGRWAPRLPSLAGRACASAALVVPRLSSPEGGVVAGETRRACMEKGCIAGGSNNHSPTAP
ncbi:unnamed protein product [Prorocentrum cordatum]|uniref:Uncharacterized protein n=1 Tax=Prorocentrum cordatum TaxID=2364126 RepID=A0ABN9VN76_9DINO|nr:unnamed protein product [Polarella glacialis]